MIHHIFQGPIVLAVMGDRLVYIAWDDIMGLPLPAWWVPV